MFHTGKFYFPKVNTNLTNKILKITNDKGTYFVPTIRHEKKYGWEQGLVMYNTGKPKLIHQLSLFTNENFNLNKNIDTVKKL